MKKLLVIGRTNVGKTLFCVRFASYLGLKDLRFIFEDADGKTGQQHMSVREAERTLSDPLAHRTQRLQSLHIEFPRGKDNRQLLLTDTTGLSDGIHPEPKVRQAMAQTLLAMSAASVILHMVDAYELGKSVMVAQGEASSLPHSTWTDLDEQVVSFGASHEGYVVLANKIDLPGARRGYKRLSERLSKHKVIPISALDGTGFREVKQHVWRMA